MNHRVCAVTAPFPGVSEWFRHGKAEGLWDLVVLRDGTVTIPEADVYLLGAWHPAYGELARQLRERGGKVVVAWSSSATEMEHAGVEMEYASAWITGRFKGIVDGWACLDKSLVPLFPNAVHLPAPVHVDAVRRVEPAEKEGLGLYAPATLKKNALTQIIASKLFQDQFPRDERRTLYTNLEPYKPALVGFGVRHEVEPWVGRDDHLERLAKRRVVLCVSHAEAWCYGAIDALAAGTVVVGSPTIWWLKRKVSNPNDPKAIHKAIERAWAASGWAGGEATSQLNVIAARQNARAKSAVRFILEKHASSR